MTEPLFPIEKLLGFDFKSLYKQPIFKGTEVFNWINYIVSLAKSKAELSSIEKTLKVFISAGYGQQKILANALSLKFAENKLTET